MSATEKLAVGEHRVTYDRAGSALRAGGFWRRLAAAVFLTGYAGLALAHPAGHSRRAAKRSSPARHQAASSSTRTAAKPATSSKSKTAPKKRRRHQYYRRASRHFVLRQKAPTRERASEIQSALAKAGYYQGDPSGKWDGKTTAALQKFQEANGLDPTGKCDAKSLQKLGLGSDIAGVGAPTPPHSDAAGSSPVSAAGASANSARPGANAAAADPAPASPPPAASAKDSPEPSAQPQTQSPAQSPKSAPGADSAAPSTPHP